MTDWLDAPDAHLDPVVAAVYDSSGAAEFEADTIDDTVGLLADLAGDGPVVEFAIGTGRVALPLTRRGLTVDGIDISEPMLDQLRAKPGADGIAITVGDMTSTVVRHDAALVYLVYNTIMNLRTQDRQVACFANAARHLRPGGRFVIETMVPELWRLGPGDRYRPFDVSPDHLGIDEYVDMVDQILISHHYHIDPRPDGHIDPHPDGRIDPRPDGHIDGPRVRRSSPAFRYAWPAELDLMARLAGLEREHRWADWRRSPFTGDSASHVSVWRKGLSG